METPENPYESPSSGQSEKQVEGVRHQLYPVAIGLLVTSILHIFGGLFYFTYVFSIAQKPGADPEGSRMLLVFCMYYGISMLYSFLLATGGFSMMRRGSYLWAFTICILAMIPFLGPCYFLAVPFGIWGVLVLKRPEVRDSFTKP